MSVTAYWQHGSAAADGDTSAGSIALEAYVAVRSKRLKSTLKVVTQYLMAGAKLRNCMMRLHTQRLAGRVLLLLVTTSSQSQKRCVYVLTCVAILQI